MANTHTTLVSLFKDIANVIREKTGTTDDIPASEFPERIAMMSNNLFIQIATGTVTDIKDTDIDGLTIIPTYAFTGCDKLRSITLPNSVTTIDAYAFYNCNKLTSVTLPSSITTINKNAFSYRYKLTINVPWAEGDIANAPWGAIDATINYNYGGE